MAEVGAPSVVVASDAFKGSLTSLEVADAVRLGVLDEVPSARVRVVAVADGGEGTVAAALAAGWRAVPVEVHGPTGEPVTTTVAVRGPRETSVPRLDTAAPQRSTAPTTTAAPQRSTAPTNTAAPQRSTAPTNTAAPGLSTVEPREGVLQGAAGATTTALVELADACGLGRLPDGIPAPLAASSRGLGEAMLAALDLGADELVIGIGGSASTDGGAGLLAALGARVLDAEGDDLPDGGAALARAARLDLSGLDRRLAGIRLVLAADVDSPLLGPSGAAAVFAPQKGATAEDVGELEAALTRWAEVVAEATSTNRSKLPQPTDSSGGTTSTNWSMLSQQAGAGAAGGVGFALLAVLGAERQPGVEVVLDLVSLDDVLGGVPQSGPHDKAGGPQAPGGGASPPALVVTGEGALDAQTLSGKAVTGVARRARAHGIPLVAVCGRLDLEPDDLATLGVAAAYPLSDLEPDPARSLADAADLLRRTGRRIARDWLSPAPG